MFFSQEKKMSGCANSIGMVKNKIRVLQEQATEATERAERLQSQVVKERSAREEVCVRPSYTCTGGGEGAGSVCHSRNVKYAAEEHRDCSSAVLRL